MVTMTISMARSPQSNRQNAKIRCSVLGGGGDAEKTSAAEKKRVLDAKDDEGVTALMKASHTSMDACFLELCECIEQVAK